MKATKHLKSSDNLVPSTAQLLQEGVEHQRPVALLVDDDYMTREMVKMSITLNQFQCRVIEAETSEQALELAEHVEVDCVISDLNRTGMDAFQFIEAFRRAHPLVPILVHSGFAYGARAQRAKELGVFQCLSKPQRMQVIHQAVTEALQWRETLTIGAQGAL